MLQPGAIMPPLPPTDVNGASLVRAEGDRLIVYFFPKSSTPPCTMEACSFRDNHGVLAERGATIVGVSPEPAAVLEAFARKYSLPFALLSDADGRLAEAFGAQVEQLWAGKTFKSVARATFLIDEHGTIRKTWESVDPRVHVRDVVTALETLTAGDLEARLHEARELAKAPIASPFETARLAEARLEDVRRRAGVAEGGTPDATVDHEAVMGVLDMLRPFMQADGGDVELVGIDSGIVKVRLQGACGTCPSSTVTLRMGIEAQLKQRVPGVQGVEAVF